MRITVAVPNRRGDLENVSLDEATKRDLDDAVSVSADNLNGDTPEAREILEDLKEELGFTRGPQKSTYPSGDVFMYISNGSTSYGADEARAKLSDLGVDI
jgi:hypothetical protein